MNKSTSLVSSNFSPPEDDGNPRAVATCREGWDPSGAEKPRRRRRRRRPAIFAVATVASMKTVLRSIRSRLGTS